MAENYNNGTVVQQHDIKNFPLASKQFSEGDKNLEQLLLVSWARGLKTISSCKGHLEKEEIPTITFVINIENIEYIGAILNTAILNNYDFSFSVGTGLKANLTIMDTEFLKTGKTDMFVNILSAIKSLNKSEVSLTDGGKTIIEIIKLVTENYLYFPNFSLDYADYKEIGHKYLSLRDEPSLGFAPRKDVDNLRALLHNLKKRFKNKEELEKLLGSPEELRKKHQKARNKMIEVQTKFARNKQRLKDDEEYAKIKFSDSLDKLKIHVGGMPFTREVATISLEGMTFEKSSDAIKYIAHALELCYKKGKYARAFWNGIELDNYSQGHDNALRIIQDYVEKYKTNINATIVSRRKPQTEEERTKVESIIRMFLENLMKKFDYGKEGKKDARRK